MFAVAALCGLINRWERVPAAFAEPTDWVRTVDGWESRQVLVRGTPPVSRQVHPGLVAVFQLGASALALAAFPARVAAVSVPSKQKPRVRRQRTASVGAAG